jgi:hypothetical protein
MKFPYPYGGSEDDIAKVNEGNSVPLRIILKDPTLSPAQVIPGSSLATAYFSLYDYATETIINERDTVSIKDDVDESGVLTINLEPADNAIIGDGGDNEELHIAIITCTMLSGGMTITFREEIGIIVSNLTFAISYPIRKTLVTSWRVLVV